MDTSLLDHLASKHGTDKGTLQHKHLAAKSYTVAYDRYLASRRHDALTMLEIGIFQGGSLRMWEDYLPNARLFAIDINPDCKAFETARTKVWIGDQTDTDFLTTVAEEIGTPIDCIIDDGGHTMEQHQKSIQTLWPCVVDGGWYAIEDLHTCYVERFGGGLGVPNSTIERYAKPAIDALNAPSGVDFDLPDLDSVHVYKSLAFFFKGIYAGGYATVRDDSSHAKAGGLGDSVRRMFNRQGTSATSS
ncbi:MAG: class I SAM-dependent methyltransferase [Pseudomonadota bacterium]